jgi:hypothetical protein
MCSTGGHVVENAMHKLLLLASTILTLVAPAASHAQAGGVEARAPQDRGFDDYDPSVELERRQFLEQELGVNLRGVCIVQTVPREADGMPTRVQICH